MSLESSDIQAAIMVQVSTLAGQDSVRQVQNLQLNQKLYIQSEAQKIYSQFCNQPAIVGSVQLSTLLEYKQVLSVCQANLENAISTVETSIQAGESTLPLSSFSTVLAKPFVPVNLRAFALFPQ